MAERLSASVAGRHMACHASAQLELAIPNFTIPPVDKMAGAKGKGTRYHKILEDMNGLPLSDFKHMLALLQYVADLRSKRRFKVLTEHQMTAEWLDSKPGTTADLILYTQDEIHVLDPKTGMIPVEVVENEQLLYYAACAAVLAPKAKGVHLHILQPWADNMDSWFADTNRIKKFMDDSLAAERAIAAGSVTFGPTDKHCTFCPANPHKRGDGKGHPLCPAMLQILYPNRGADEDAILSL